MYVFLLDFSKYRFCFARKAIFTTLLGAYPAKKNAYLAVNFSEVGMDSLFVQ